MEYKYKKYKIKTDEHCFILEKTIKIKEGIRTKEENIGKERQETVGYYNTFEQALNGISNQIFFDNEDIKDVMIEHKKLHEAIKELSSKFDNINLNNNSSSI